MFRGWGCKDSLGQVVGDGSEFGQIDGRGRSDGGADIDDTW